MLEYIALGMVLDNMRTGYEIKKEIEVGVGNFYKASYGSLYPALKKLTDKGYLNMMEQARGNRLKKFYIATELGRGAFLEWLSAPLDAAANSEPHLEKLYFFGELPKDIRNSLIEEYEAYADRILRKLKVIEKQNSDRIKSGRDYFELSTLYFGLQNTYTTLRWFKHIREGKPLTEFVRKYE